MFALPFLPAAANIIGGSALTAHRVRQRVPHAVVAAHAAGRIARAFRAYRDRPSGGPPPAPKKPRTTAPRTSTGSGGTPSYTSTSKRESSKMPGNSLHVFSRSKFSRRRRPGRRARIMRDIGNITTRLAHANFTIKTGYTTSDQTPTNLPKVAQQGHFWLANLRPIDMQNLWQDVMRNKESADRQGTSTWSSLNDNRIQQFVYKSFHRSTQMINSNTIPIKLTIMELACRNDDPEQMNYYTPVTSAVDHGIAYETTPTDTWRAGIEAIRAVNDPESPATAYPLSNLTIGTKPEQSPIFRRHFKVLSKMSKILAPGEIHRHYTFLTPNLVVDQNTFHHVLDSAAGTDKLFRNKAGLTTYTFILIEGTIAVSNPSELEEAPTAKVTVAPCRLDILSTVKDAYYLGHVVAPRQRFYTHLPMEGLAQTSTNQLGFQTVIDGLGTVGPARATGDAYVPPPLPGS